jgi:hypothetical protein
LLVWLERYVGELTDSGIDLIQRPLREGIDLHRVDEAVANGLHAGGGDKLARGEEHGQVSFFKVQRSSAAAGRRREDRRLTPVLSHFPEGEDGLPGGMPCATVCCTSAAS